MRWHLVLTFATHLLVQTTELPWISSCQKYLGAIYFTDFSISAWTVEKRAISKVIRSITLI